MSSSSAVTVSTSSSASTAPLSTTGKPPTGIDALYGWKRFAGLYGAEHIAATEFVIGATFVSLGAGTRDILVGLLIGNLLAMLTFGLLTARIATETRLTVFGYLKKVAGPGTTRLYCAACVLVFGAISAAMITVSASAIRVIFEIPAQLDWYPNDPAFVLVVAAIGLVVVTVAAFGFQTLAEFSSICAPWMLACFVCGALVLMPQLTHSVLGHTQLGGFGEFMQVADNSVWRGVDTQGRPGVGAFEIAGFAWACISFAHAGLVDMSLLRFARKSSYGYLSGAGLIFGHYLAWICSGLMGAGAALVIGRSLLQLDPGDVGSAALGAIGLLVVIVAGWTTANSNLYRAGLAAHTVFPKQSRSRVTFITGVLVVVAAAFPFVFRQMLPLLTYAGIAIVPIGAVLTAEHLLFPRLGLTRYWASYRKLSTSTPALAAWGAGLACAAWLDWSDWISFYYIFIPEFLVAMLVYLPLAKRAGASQRYPEAEAHEAERQRELKAYLVELERQGDDGMLPSSALGVWSSRLAWISLLAMVAGALMVFATPDIEEYVTRRALFENFSIGCTLAYFAFGLLALRDRRAPSSTASEDD